MSALIECEDMLVIERHARQQLLLCPVGADGTRVRVRNINRLKFSSSIIWLLDNPKVVPKTITVSESCFDHSKLIVPLLGVHAARASAAMALTPASVL
jgi:hypothetical protein